MNRKSFFWTGVLVGNNVEHAIFEVRVKRKIAFGQLVGFLLTKDVPPVPILEDTDVVKVSFYLENCTGLPPMRYLIVEDQVEAAAVEENQLGEQCTVKTETGEWTFMRVRSQDPENPVTPWFLIEINLRIPDARFKQYLQGG